MKIRRTIWGTLVGVLSISTGSRHIRSPVFAELTIVYSCQTVVAKLRRSACQCASCGVSRDEDNALDDFENDPEEVLSQLCGRTINSISASLYTEVFVGVQCTLPFYFAHQDSIIPVLAPCKRGFCCLQGLDTGEGEEGQEGEPMEVHEGQPQPSDRPRMTSRYMTKYERARVLGTRALQIRCASLHHLLAATPAQHLCKRSLGTRKL